MLNIKTKFLKVISIFLLFLLVSCGGDNDDKEAEVGLNSWEGSWTSAVEYYKDPKAEVVFDKLAPKITLAKIDAATLKQFFLKQYKTGAVVTINFTVSDNSIAYLDQAGAELAKHQYKLAKLENGHFYFQAKDAPGSAYEYLIIGEPHGQGAGIHWHGMFAGDSFAKVLETQEKESDGVFNPVKVSIDDFVATFNDKRIQAFADYFNKPDGSLAKWLKTQQ